MTATKGRRILPSIVLLIILWMLLTIFIHMKLDSFLSNTQRQAPSSTGHGRRQVNPLDVIRDSVSLTDHGRVLSRTALDTGSKPRGDVSSSDGDLRSPMNRSENTSIRHRVKRLERKGIDPMDKKRWPQPLEKQPLKDLGAIRRAYSRRKPMVMEPKIYDTQGQATVCVSRNVETNTCQLHRCGSVVVGKHDSKNPLDDFGFVVHERNNTRGHSPVTAGWALAGSGCAISHRYKFVYIHVLKSGGMTIKTLLKRGLCGGVTQTCEDLQIVDCDIAVEDYPSYFVFSFVRNPFSRIYSAYSMAASMQSPNWHSVSFEEFATMSRGQRRNASKTSPAHYDPQINFLMDYSHCPVFDFLGRLERFREDMQIILNQIQSPDLQAYFNSTGGMDLRENCTSYGERKKQSELGGNLRNAYQSQATIDAIAKEFESDFTLLGYDPTQVL
ncbi:sulfotransferase family [Fragilaria crotonensis]|nr:sulfotransferase family [Fragilaria crotonensis]